MQSLMQVWTIMVKHKEVPKLQLLYPLAFDPLFWLHHANVDRVLSLWQVIHYDSWIEPAADGNDTWVTKPGDLLDKNSRKAGL